MSSSWEEEKKKKFGRDYQTLVGEKFGKLTVESVEKLSEGTNALKKILCHCVCDCGEHKDVLAVNLVAKPPHGILSCGCLRSRDISGWVISEHGVPNSRLTALRYDHTAQRVKKDGKVAVEEYWLFRCSCASHTEKVLRKNSVLAGEILSCGCLAKECISALGTKSQKENQYELFEEFGYGVGYCGNTGTPFYFDLEDYEKIKKYYWREWKSPHANYSCPTTSLRKEDGEKAGMIIKMWALLGLKGYDHINHNPFDNRKENLRPCTQQQNAFNSKKSRRNTSGIIGVNKLDDCPKRPWRARLVFNRKEIPLGYFENFEDAVRARLEGEKKYYGEFAPQRHLFAQYGIEENEEEEK